MRPDGLTIANMSASTIPLAILGEVGVEYDIDKWVHLGTFYSVRHTVFITGRAAGLDTLDKLRNASGLRIGEQSVGFPSYIRSRFFAWLLGLREPKFVTGYSSPEMDIALINGEIDARQHSAGSLAVEKGRIGSRKSSWTSMSLWKSRREPSIPILLIFPKSAPLPQAKESASYWQYFGLSRFSVSLMSRLLVFPKIG